MYADKRTKPTAIMHKTWQVSNCFKENFNLLNKHDTKKITRINRMSTNRCTTRNLFKNHPTLLQISLIFSVGSLALSIASVLCNDLGLSHINPSSVSFPQNYASAQNAQRQAHVARPAELHSSEFYPIRNSASSAAALERQATQPSVYHSIIDRTNGPILNASPAIQTSSSTMGDLNTAAGHHHGHAYGKYYEHRSVPHKKTWKYGYKRGNHKHTISRHEHGKAGKHPHFKTKVKWHDKKSKGKGIHLWDYNHHDKKHYHHG